MFNIVLGIVFVIGGATGNMALIGTNSSGALVVVGIGLVVWGGIQVARSASE